MGSKCNINIKRTIKNLASPKAIEAINKNGLDRILNPIINKIDDTTDIDLLGAKMYAIITSNEDISAKQSIVEADTIEEVNKIAKAPNEASVDVLKARKIDSPEQLTTLIKNTRESKKAGSGTTVGSVLRRKVTDTDGGLLQYIMQMPAKDVVIDGKTVNLTSLKEARVDKMKGLKPTLENSWSAFLSTYFVNATGYGVEFKNFVEDKILNTLVDFKKGKGISKDINAAVQELKKTTRTLANMQSMDNIHNQKLPLRDVLADTRMKDTYFANVLNSEFDFLVASVNNMVAAETSGKGFEKINTKVLGLTDINSNDPDAPLFLDLDGLPPQTLKTIGSFKDGVFILNDNVDLEIYDSPKRYAFHKDSYGRVFFSNRDGSKIREVTPKVHYSLNTDSSTRNFDSIDHVVDALDQDTTFIRNIFPLFRYINADGTVGNRMSYRDYLRIAPRLFGTEVNPVAIEKKLIDMSRQEGSLSNIARSLLYYVFSSPNKNLEGARISSLRSIALNENNIESMNADVVRSLMAALTNKTQVRFLEVNGSHTRATQKATDKDFMYLINDSLEIALLDGVDIKDNIKSILSVQGSSIYVTTGTGRKLLNEVTSPAEVEVLANELGITKLYNDLKMSLYDSETSHAKADDILAEIVQDVTKVAAANKKENPYVDNIYKKTVSEGKGAFLYTSPSTFLYRHRNYLEDVLQPDTTKQLTVAGNKAAATTLPNRNSFIPKQIKEYAFFDKNVSEVPVTFMPFIKTKLSESIPAAEFIGEVIKTPIMHNGKPIKLSAWSTKVRVEHALVQGLIKLPMTSGGQQVGHNMALQVIAYSDKSQIPFHEINIPSINVFENSKAVHKKLRKAYIKYNIEKNESLQRITVNKFKKHIVSNFNAIYSKINNDTTLSTEEKATRLEGLKELRNKLVEMSKQFKLPVKDRPKGDMLRPINTILTKVKLDSNDILYSNSELDEEVDYTTMGNILVLKPSVGARAAQYRANGEAIVDSHIATYKDEISRLDIDKEMISRELKKAGVDISADTFLERAFFLYGVYGHGLKVMTMGDESYFDTYYPYNNIDEYYEAVQNDPTIPLKDTSNMIIKQSKRAQSVLTNGQRYAQRETVEGMKRRAPKDNIFHYADVSNLNEIGFKQLIGKDLYELEGLGVIEAFEDGSIIADNGIVQVNAGKHRVLLDLNHEITPDLKRVKGMPEVHAILSTAFIKTKSSPLFNPNVEGKTHIDLVNTKKVVKRGDRNWVEIQNILDKHMEMRNDNIIMLPDYMPSILLSDPVSNVDVLNKMGVNQENSDAIQMYHPFYYKLFQVARGGTTSGYFNDKYTALKTLTTTMEYDSFRQSLQKKSGQVPFAMEQFIKLGGPEAYQMFDKLNRSIDFPTTKMKIPSVDENGRVLYKTTTDMLGNTKKEVIYEDAVIKNMGELFDHFKGWERMDESVWDDVLLTLSKYGENLYSFVGIISVPSNQKTGHRKFNKWDNAFGESTKPLVIDHMANEYNFEVLSKGHDYDVSTESTHSSKLTLLSQLVNAVGFGGLTNSSAKLLQDAISTVADFQGARIGAEFAKAGEELISAVPSSKMDIFREVYNNVKSGDLSGGEIIRNGGNETAEGYYRDIVLAGLADTVENAFNDELDSDLFKEIVKEKGTSLDAPSVRERLMTMLRSNLYKEAIQIKMNGFIAVVSGTHNLINIYDIGKTGKRGGRKSYIDYFLDKPNSKELVSVTPENLAEVKRRVLPFDKILVNGSKLFVRAHYDLDALVANGADVKVVMTPEKKPNIDINEYHALDELAKISLTIGNRKSVVYKWRAEELMKAAGVTPADLIVAGKLHKDTTDDFSLRWYEIKSKDGDIKNTKEYKNFYRLQTTTRYKKWSNSQELAEHEIKVEAARAALTALIQKVDNKGNKVWKVLVPEVVMPTFNAKAFEIEEGTALHEIGTDLVSVASYFLNKPHKNFVFETYEDTKDKTILRTRYLKKKALSLATDIRTNTAMYDEIIAMLDAAPDTGVTKESINNIVRRHKMLFAKRRAMAFLESLDITAARIPGQSKQSGFAARVVEFLDSQGNAAHAPVEHMINTGDDMDIDTLSVLTKKLSKDGMIKSYKGFMNEHDELDVKKLKSYYTNGLGVIKNTLTKAKVDYNTALVARGMLLDTKIKSLSEEIEKLHKDYADALNNLNEQLINEENPKKQDILNKTIEKNKANNENILKRLEQRKSRAENEKLTLNDRRITDETLKKHIEKAQKNLFREVMDAMSNALEAGVRTSLSSIDAMMELQTPVSFDIFSGIFLAIEEMKVGKDGRPIPDSLANFKHANYNINGESYLSTFLLEDLAAKGKEAIGIYATVLKMLSAVQVAKADYTRSNRGGVNPFKFGTILRYNSPYYKKTKTVIRDTFADLERFDIMEKIAKTPELQKVLRELKAGKPVSNAKALETLESMMIDMINESYEEIKKFGKLSDEDVEAIAKEKIKDTLGIDLDHEILSRNRLAIDGKTLASEFINC